MNPTLIAFGVNLAVVALTAAKAAGDALLSHVAAEAESVLPALTDRGLVDFLDVVPATYRAEIQALFEGEFDAAKSALDGALTVRIHTGCAIAQTVLDMRISALQTRLLT